MSSSECVEKWAEPAPEAVRPTDYSSMVDRAWAVRDAIQKRDLLLRQIGFESPRRGECRALMLGVI